MNLLANRIARRRSELGLLQKQVACIAGITQPALSVIESGEVNPNIITLIGISKALDLQVSELVEGL
jgi:transcriptional regulator with XRE-family HTH domain